MGVGGRDDAAAMFQQFKMGMGASSVASAVGSQDSSAPKPYAVRMVSAPVHAHALLDEVIPEDETPPPPRPQVGTAGISGGGGQRPAGAKPRVRINDQAAEREIPGKDGKKGTSKAPKIQRLVTPQVLQRKRARLALKKKWSAKSKAAAAEYEQMLAARAKAKRAEQASKRSKRSGSKA